MNKSVKEINDRLKIVIIEDDMRYRAIISQAIPDAEKIFANDEESGWNAFIKHAPDITFLSINDKTNNNMDLLKKIREFDESSFVVIITNSQLTSDFNATMQLGASGYIPKPFNNKSLANYIKKYQSMYPNNVIGLNRKKTYDEKISRHNNKNVKIDKKQEETLNFLSNHNSISELYTLVSGNDTAINPKIELPKLASKWKVLLAGVDEVLLKTLKQILIQYFAINPDIAYNSDDALKMLMNETYNIAFITLKFQPKSGYHVVNEYITFNGHNPNSTYLIGLKGDNFLDDTEKWQQAGLNAIVNFDEQNWIDSVKRLIVYYTKEQAIFLTKHLNWYEMESDFSKSLQKEKHYQELSKRLANVFSEPLRIVLEHTVSLEETERREQSLKSISEIKHWTTLNIKRLQALSEYENTNINKPFLKIPLSEILQITLKDLIPTVKKHGAKIKTFGTLPEIEVHPLYFKKALYNIMKNGIEYNKSLPPTIGISCHERDDEWVIKIQDNGVGIQNVYKNHIFSLFESLNIDHEHAGMGLPISKNIIEQHGGNITFESNGNGQGSTFFIAFPKNQDQKNDTKPIIIRSEQQAKNNSKLASA